MGADHSAFRNRVALILSAGVAVCVAVLLSSVIRMPEDRYTRLPTNPTRLMIAAHQKQELARLTGSFRTRPGVFGLSSLAERAAHFEEISDLTLQAFSGDPFEWHDIHGISSTIAVYCLALHQAHAGGVDMAAYTETLRATYETITTFVATDKYTLDWLPLELGVLAEVTRRAEFDPPSPQLDVARVGDRELVRRAIEALDRIDSNRRGLPTFASIFRLNVLTNSPQDIANMPWTSFHSPGGGQIVSCDRGMASIRDPDAPACAYCTKPSPRSFTLYVEPSGCAFIFLRPDDNSYNYSGILTFTEEDAHFIYILIGGIH